MAEEADVSKKNPLSISELNLFIVTSTVADNTLGSENQKIVLNI